MFQKSKVDGLSLQPRQDPNGPKNAHETRKFYAFRSWASFEDGCQVKRALEFIIIQL